MAKYVKSQKMHSRVPYGVEEWNQLINTDFDNCFHGFLMDNFIILCFFMILQMDGGMTMFFSFMFFGNRGVVKIIKRRKIEGD